MGLIGDVYYAFRGDGARLKKDAQVEGSKAGTTLAQSTIASFKKSWSGANIGKGFVQGLGLAGGLGAISLIGSAIGKVGDIVADANQAFLDEERSIQKLGTSLRANVKDWDGNTDAIERVLKARMALGFSDDEQRESLALLVAATKDVNKALEIQRTAMDLARLKGISLADASTALIKVEAGQFRALKALGIQLKAGATQTEALAAVQAVAAGQAEDYADTNEGKLLVSQVKIGEALEKLGEKTLPIMVEGTVAAAGAVTTLADAFGVLTGETEMTAQQQSDLGRDLLHMAASLPFVGSGFQALATTADKTMTDISVGADHARDGIEGLKGGAVDDLGRTVVALDDTGEAADDMQDEIRAAALGSSKAFDDMKQSMVADASELIDDVYDPIITQDRLRATEAEIAAQREILASSTSTAAQKRDAKDRLHELTKDNAQFLLELAEAGKTNSKAYADGLKELKEQIKKAKGPAKAALQQVLDKILEIERVGKVVPINLIVAAQTTQWAKNLAGNLRAAGGPVSAGVPYVVGERRAELFVPETNGRILPSVPSSFQAPGPSAGGGDTINVNLLDKLQVRSARDIGDGLRMLERRGYMKRSH